MSRKRIAFNTIEEGQEFIHKNNLENCELVKKGKKYNLIQKVKAIFGKNIYTSSSNKGLMMCDDNMTFDQMIAWVYRNCPGCDKIEVLPNKVVPEVIAYYQDRIEIYTLEDYDIVGNKEI